MSYGVLQGSVLEPLLWNVAFDTMFRLPIPRCTVTIGYVDDTLVVFEGNTLEAVQNRANAELAIVADHIWGFGIQLAIDKMQAVVFKPQNGPADLRLLIEGQTVRPGALLKYLGVVHENKSTYYGARLRATVDKAGQVMAALSGLMPNVAVPGSAGGGCLRVSYIQ